MPRLLVLVALFGLFVDRPLSAQQVDKLELKLLKAIDELKKELAERDNKLASLKEEHDEQVRLLQKKIRELAAEQNELKAMLEAERLLNAQAKQKKKKAVKETPPVSEVRAMMRMLEETFDTKGLREDRVKLKEALEYLDGKFGGKLPILIDREAFLAELGPDAPDLHEEEVVLPRMPEKMQLAVALRILVGQAGGGRGTYLVRPRYIEITTLKAAAAVNLLRAPKLFGSFEDRPLREVVRDLADESGLDIHLDTAVDKKADVLITTRFRNATLENALVVVTEMAGLKFVVLERSVFVTTPQNAELLRREEKERQLQRKPLPPIDPAAN